MANDQTSPPEPPSPPVSTFGSDIRLFHQHPAIKPPRSPGVLGTLDNYELLSVIGHGGMGLVFRARDTTTNQIVAVKLLRTELAGNAQAQHRFARESRHMSQLRHPNILEVLAVGTRQDIPYFVMPFVERGSLAAVLRPDAPLEIATCLRIAIGIAQALQFAHAKGITHRDLKPGNVLLEPGDTPRLTDFGLARTLYNDSLTNLAEPQAEGTAAYMSPQLARLEAEDTRCDIYAFGALLYEMLTARVPYEGESNAVVLEKIRRGPPVPIAELRPDAPTELVRIAETAMAREHRDRYASMNDVVAELERIQRGEKLRGASTPRRLTSRIGLAATACIALAAALVIFKLIPGSVELERRCEATINEVREWSLAQSGDWDNDGAVDFVALSKDTLFGVSSHGFQHPSQRLEIASDFTPYVRLLFDADNDGDDDAFVTWTRGTNAYLTIFNQKGFPWNQYHFAGRVHVHDQWGSNYTHLQPLRVADLDEDGTRELLVAVLTGWGKTPRGLACYDLASTKLEWFQPTAGLIVEVDLIDTDGDDRVEIVVGSNSPKNGNRLPDGTHDYHPYVYLLNALDGEIRWQRELGGRFTRASLVFGRTNAATPLVWVSSHGAFDRKEGVPFNSQLLEFDATGKTNQQFVADQPFTGALAMDLNNDGAHEVLATDWLGNLNVFDHQLRKQQSIAIVTNRFDDVQMILERSENYLLITSRQIQRLNEIEPGNTRKTPHHYLNHDDRITVLDSRLRPVVTHQFADTRGESAPFAARLIPSPGQTYPQLAVLSEKVEVYNLVERPWYQKKRPVSNVKMNAPLPWSTPSD